MLKEVWRGERSAEESDGIEVKYERESAVWRDDKVVQGVGVCGGGVGVGFRQGGGGGGGVGGWGGGGGVGEGGGGGGGGSCEFLLIHKLKE